ncbi:MAG: serine/threonine protein kinase [Planctomycetes bacterium]|nr:serine/threonine protein kinase [Planctomycetota bacterium]
MTSHPFLATAFGLRIAATCAIPGLIECPAGDRQSDAVDVRIWLGRRPDWVLEARAASDGTSDIRYVSSRVDAVGKPLLVVSEWTEQAGRLHYVASGLRHFQYADGVEFLLDRETARIWAGWSGETTLDDAAVYLLGPILGYVLRTRGVTCLHASVVAANETAFAFVGSARSGKSTAAAAFARLGLPVLSDDVAAICELDGRFHVRPAYPQLRLWPDSVERLFGSRDALAPLTPQCPQWDKRYLSLVSDGEHSFMDRPLPLRAVYVLGARETSDTAPRIEPLPPRERLLKLIANSYTGYLATAADQRREFHLLRSLIEAMPVRHVIPHADPARIPDLCSAIMTDLAFA